MAVALAIGQALLCALIGWLTLGQARSDHRGSGTAVDQAAAPPPPVVPASPPVLTSRATQAPTSKTRKPTRAQPQPRRAAEHRLETWSPRPATSAPTVPPQSAEPSSAATTSPATPIMLPPEPTSASPSPSPRDLPTPESGTGGDEIQRNVTIGDDCRPEGAYGRTRDGRLVRCLRGWRDPPRWKIV
jgi:hypothetical protein